MRIGFFGGSFDPPHRGHVHVALAAAARCGLDLVLLAPAAVQPLKPDGPAASFADRLEMVRLLCDHEPMLQASALDAPRPDGSPNFTIDTLHRLATMLNTGETLKQKAPAQEAPAQASSQSAITVIVGIDAFLHIHDWRSPDALLDGFDWAVVSRPSFDLSRVETIGLTLHQRARVTLIDGVAELVSATAIRETLRQHKDVTSLVPPSVLAYIREHHLYGDAL